MNPKHILYTKDLLINGDIYEFYRLLVQFEPGANKLPPELIFIIQIIAWKELHEQGQLKGLSFYPEKWVQKNPAKAQFYREFKELYSYQVTKKNKSTLVDDFFSIAFQPIDWSSFDGQQTIQSLTQRALDADVNNTNDYGYLIDLMTNRLQESRHISSRMRTNFELDCFFVDLGSHIMTGSKIPKAPVVYLPWPQSFSMPLFFALNGFGVITQKELPPLDAAFTRLVPFLFGFEWQHILSDPLPGKDMSVTKLLSQADLVCAYIRSENMQSLVKINRNQNTPLNSTSPESGDMTDKLKYILGLKKEHVILAVQDSFAMSMTNKMIQVRQDLAPALNTIFDVPRETATLGSSKCTVVHLAKRDAKGIKLISYQSMDKDLNLNFFQLSEYIDLLQKAKPGDQIEYVTLKDLQKNQASFQVSNYLKNVQSEFKKLANDKIEFVPFAVSSFEMISMRQIPKSLQIETPENFHPNKHEQFHLVSLLEIPEFGFVPGYGHECTFQKPVFRNRPQKTLSIHKGSFKPILLEPYDVVISLAGDIGWVGLIPAEAEGQNWTTNHGFATIRVKPDYANEKEELAIWIYMYLKSDLGQLQLSAFNIDTRTPRLSVKMFDKLMLPNLNASMLKIARKKFREEIRLYEGIYDLYEKVYEMRRDIWK